ncbi:hypothetical protein [Chroococcidiopsis sp.]|uniref:hypothetical protein n=1 Tax=Chroococcidiopsis sp. TaxID=3088168 RepID=UPI003F3F09BE
MVREQGAGSREQGAGSREQGAGSREQGAGSRGELNTHAPRRGYKARGHLANRSLHHAPLVTNDK